MRSLVDFPAGLGSTYGALRRGAGAGARSRRSALGRFRRSGRGSRTRGAVECGGRRVCHPVRVGPARIRRRRCRRGDRLRRGWSLRCRCLRCRCLRCRSLRGRLLRGRAFQGRAVRGRGFLRRRGPRRVRACRLGANRPRDGRLRGSGGVDRLVGGVLRRRCGRIGLDICSALRLPYRTPGAKLSY